MIENLTEVQIREAAKGRIETLERWLRRLVDESFRQISVSYENYADEAGNRLIKNDIKRRADERRNGNTNEYPRFIDAVLLDDLITIICGQWSYFSDALSEAFPEGRDEARTFLKRLVGPRNKLAHANTLSLREAERVMCYSGDVLDSLKQHYKLSGKKMTYNVPNVIHFSDSFGMSFHRHQMSPVSPIGVMLDFSDDANLHLRPGDILTLEVSIDPAFEPSEYSVSWMAFGPPIPGDTSKLKVVVPITIKHVGEQLDFRCTVVSNKDWHKSPTGFDDMFDASYRVLPPDQ